MTERAITKEELAELLIKYNIGKKPLATLLGWGATTVLLYMQDDEIPDNEYSRRLYRLYENPGLFFNELNENKDRISNIAYRKCLESVLSILSPGKLYEAADYIIRAVETETGKGELSLVRLETILFWSQAVSLSLNGKAIFDEDYQPGRSGMPYRTVEERYLKYGRCLMGQKNNVQSTEFSLSERDMEVIDYCRNVFSWYGSSALIAFMDAERSRLCGPVGARKRRTVSKEIIKRCYTEVFGQAKVHKLKDVEAYIHKRITFIRKNEGKN